MSAERMEVHPTRLELLALKRRKTLAEGIADILQKDLEVLIFSLVEHRERASDLQTQLYNILEKSYNQFIESEMMRGSLKVKQLVKATVPTNFKLETSTATGVLGIQFPSIKLIKLQKNMVSNTKLKKLNLGCGKDIRTDFINVDIAKRPGVDKVVDLNKRLPFKNNYFDIIYASNVLEHIKDIDGLFKDLYRLLKKKGLNIMIDWKKDMDNFLDQYGKELLKQAKTGKS